MAQCFYYRSSSSSSESSRSILFEFDRRACSDSKSKARESYAIVPRDRKGDREEE